MYHVTDLTMEKYCEACGMPLIAKEDFAKGDMHAKFCVHCVDEEGNVKTCDEIFEGGVQFFLSQIGGDRVMAEKITRKNMNMQPYWQGNDFAILKGAVATDEEFADTMKKMS